MDVARERGVLDLVPGLDPVDALGLLGPEPFRVLDRLLVHLLVSGVIAPGLLRPGRGNRINLRGHCLVASSSFARHDSRIPIEPPSTRGGKRAASSAGIIM